MNDFLQDRVQLPKSAGLPTRKALLEPLGARQPEGSPHSHASVEVLAKNISDEPSVELKHDDQGRISEITVVCRCGERITLRCNY